MLNVTTVAGERVVAIFPCIGTDFEGNLNVVDATVITVNETGGFTMRFVNQNGEPRWADGSPYNRFFSTFPAALRAARQSQGWG